MKYTIIAIVAFFISILCFAFSFIAFFFYKTKQKRKIWTGERFLNSILIISTILVLFGVFFPFAGFRVCMILLGLGGWCYVIANYGKNKKNRSEDKQE